MTTETLSEEWWHRFWLEHARKPRLKLATGYLGGRLQELADQAYIENGRWMVNSYKTLKQAIDETFERDQNERRTSAATKPE